MRLNVNEAPSPKRSSFEAPAGGGGGCCCCCFCFDASLAAAAAALSPSAVSCYFFRKSLRRKRSRFEFFDRSIETSKRASTSSDASLCWHQSPLFSDPHFFLEATEALGFTGEAPTALLERVERVDWGMISETIISEKKNGKCGRPSCLSWRPLFAARGSPRDSLVFFLFFFFSSRHARLQVQP